MILVKISEGMFAFSCVGILELTCEQFWLLHLRILYVGLRWQQVTVGPRCQQANKSPFLAPIYDQVPSMLYKPQKHVYKQTNLIKQTFLLKLCPKYLQKEISKIHIKRKTNNTCTKNSKKHLRIIGGGEHQKRRGGAQGKSLF